MCARPDVYILFFFEETLDWIDSYLFASAEQMKVLALEMSIEALQTGTELAGSKHSV